MSGETTGRPRSALQIEDLSTNTGYQLWLATNCLQRILRSGLAPLRLTFVQFLVLDGVSLLSAVGEAVSQSEVCGFCSTDPNMTSQVVRALEQKALLKRSANPSDGRSLNLSLTPAGETLLIAARERLKPLIQAFFAPLGDRQQELTEMLRLVLDAAEG